MVMETVKVMATATLAAAAHLFALKNHQPTQEHKKHKRLSKSLLCLFESLLCLFVALFVASSLLRGGFSFLFFVETFLIFLEPRFQVVRGFLELVAVQQSASQRFEECARANVVGEFLVRFVVRAFSD